MTGWLIEAIIGSTVLMLAVLLLRVPVRKAFGADIAYALWMLPVLRMALPPLPAAWHEAAVAPVLRAAEPVTILFVDPVVQNAAEPTAPWLFPALVMLWVAGAIGFIAWHGVAHLRFCRRLLASAALNGEVGGVRVIETAAASGPLAFGIWRRYVAFPRDFAERYEPEERDLALAHELGHHARGDLIANWIALAVLALHWFNPVAWRAFRAFRADQEIANDARVLRGLNPIRRHTYACAIVKAAHGGAVSAACHLHTIEDLKGRLRMLTTTKTSRTRLFAGTAALTVFVTAGLGLTASGTAAAAKVRSTVEHATGVDLAALDQAAPVAPAAPSTAAPVAPPSVPAAPVVDGKPPKHRYKVVVMEDEKTVTEHVYGDTPPAVQTRVIKRVFRRDKNGNAVPVDLRAMPIVVNMPQISSGNCKFDGKPDEMVKHSEKDGKPVIVICSNRIRMAAEKGAVMAANSEGMERKAYAEALAGLRTARARMVDSTDMTADARRQALEGIDTAIKEIEGDLAKAQ